MTIEQEKILKRMDQPEEPVFLLCPKCQYECGRFTEVTEELCNQRGINIQSDGKLNYDDADCVENLGETVRVVCYECEECETAFNLVDGKLIEWED